MRIEGLINAIKERQASKEAIFVVETGTIRNIGLEYKEGDGHSTRFIVEMMRERDAFISIDLDVKVCSDYLTSLNLIHNVLLIEGDSRRVLNMVDNIDVAYLDSDNNCSLIYDEFSIVIQKMNPGGYIIIDDCYPDSKDVVKCHKVKQLLDDTKYPYKIINNQMVIQIG